VYAWRDRSAPEVAADDDGEAGEVRHGLHHVPADVPEREARDGGPVRDERRETGAREAARARVRLGVARGLEALELPHLRADARKPAAQVPRAVRERRHRDAERDGGRRGLGAAGRDVDDELAAVRGVADEVGDVRRVAPLGFLAGAACAGRAEGDARLCGRE
jgi:hypothetical protein